MNHRSIAVAALVAGVLFVGAGCASLEPEAPTPADPSTGSVEEAGGAVVPEAAVASVADTSTAYRLGEGDVISIQVFDEPDLTMGARIGASETINYSYLGDIKVAGKTPLELEREIAGYLRDGYLVNPSVNVTIEQFRPFFVNGEVRSPGGYSYQPGLTLGKALTLAGGITDRASSRKIFVSRAAGAEQNTFKADMGTLIAPGDIISVKEGFF